MLWTKAASALGGSSALPVTPGEHYQLIDLDLIQDYIFNRRMHAMDVFYLFINL